MTFTQRNGSCTLYIWQLSSLLVSVHANRSVNATLFLLTVNAAAPLFLCPRLVPKITQATLFLTVLGFLVSFALVIGLKKHTQPSSFITQPGLGTSGWGSGTAWVLGLGNAM